MNKKERRRPRAPIVRRADFSAESLASWAKRAGMSEEQAIQICDNLKNDFQDSANNHKAPITLVMLVLMQLVADCLAQQAANRDDVSESVETAANALEDLTLHAFDRRVLKQ
jgi:hypothetical protein